MYHRCALFALLIVGTGRAPAQASSKMPRDTDEKTVLVLEDTWTTALVRRDGRAFERLLAPGFVYTEDDRMVGRADVLRDVQFGADTVRESHNEKMETHRFGSTIVVTGWLIVRGRGKEGPFDRKYRFTDTWVRSGGRWRIVAAQDYLVPAGKGGP